MNGGDYESFVRNVLQDFDDRVLAVQKKAEESITAYEAYCGELKSQLIALKLENESLKRQPGGNDSNVQQLLRAMTGLCIHSTDNSGGSLLRYSCSVMEGALKGHAFTLIWDQDSREYTYNPEKSPIKNLQQIASDFSCVIIFPEDMLSKFWINLLHVIHSQY